METDRSSRVVSLDNLRKSSVIVQKGEEWKNDIFEPEYRQAASSVQKIIHRSRELQNEIEDSGRLDDDLDVEERIHTTIPFIGKRGVGKTSGMETILYQLSKCDGNSAARDLFGLQDDSTAFICLEPIDVGMLQSGEDIMEIILARMLNHLLKLTGEGANSSAHARYQEELRDIYRGFDGLYRSLSHLRNSRHFSEGESALRELQDLASSHSTAKQFRALTEEFLAYAGNLRDETAKRMGNRRKDYFLVVTLDDVDMYQGSEEPYHADCYTLLEEIYDYLSFPGIIVLMSYNETMLKRNCNNHLRKKFFEGKSYESCTETERGILDSLVQQFLSKLIADEQRIYMPDLYRIDVSNQVGLMIRLSEKEGSLPFGGKDTVLPLKEFTLRMLAYKTGVYFDACGQKRHFFEPRNLRELSALVRVIDSMKMDDGQGEAEAMRADNRRLLLNYTYNQFAGEVLTEADEDYFYRLSQQPLQRQKQIFVDDVQQLEGKGGNAPSRWQYSYGEFVYSLYRATRFEQNAFSKPLISCILSSHSVILNQMWENVRTDDKPEWKRVIEQIKGHFGSSIAGRWANRMLPQVMRPIEEKASLPTDRYPVPMGSVSLDVNGIFDFALPNDVVEALKAAVFENKTMPQLNQFVQAMELLSMFFTHRPEKGMLWTVEKVKPDEKTTPPLKEYQYYLRSEQKDNVCFNVLNFVVHALDYETFFDHVQQDLTELGKRCYKEMKENKPVQESKDFEKWWNKTIRACSLRKVVRRKYIDKVPLPVFHFDMMYNLIKRAASGAFYGRAFPEAIEKEQAFDSTAKLYRFFRDELAKQDAFYYDGLYKASQGFVHAYCDCPLIRAFTGNPDAEDKKEPIPESPILKFLYNEMIGRMARAQMRPSAARI